MHFPQMILHPVITLCPSTAGQTFFHAILVSFSIYLPDDLELKQEDIKLLKDCTILFYSSTQTFCKNFFLILVQSAMGPSGVECRQSNMHFPQMILHPVITLCSSTAGQTFFHTILVLFSVYLLDNLELKKEDIKLPKGHKIGFQCTANFLMLNDINSICVQESNVVQ